MRDEHHGRRSGVGRREPGHRVPAEAAERDRGRQVAVAQGAHPPQPVLERDDHDLELVSINDLADTKSNALLFQYDSTHGRFPGTVEVGDNAIIVNGKSIAVTSERDPGNLPHADQGVDIVLECTGFFQSHEAAEPHLKAGAKRVLICSRP